MSSASESIADKAGDARWAVGAEDTAVGWVGGDGGVGFTGYDAGLADILEVKGHIRIANESTELGG
jgi:hypothetical protein